MNITRFFLVLSLAVLCAGTATTMPPSDVKLTTRIAGATVYSDRAMVTREGTITLEQGIKRVTIGGVPRLLNDETVRVTAAGTAEAKILEVKVERVYLDSVRGNRMQPLLQKSKALADELQKLTDRSSVLQQQRDFLGKIGIASGESISQELRARPPKVEDWKNLLGFFDQELTKLNAEARDIRARKQELEQAFNNVQSEIRELGGRAERNEKQIAVLFEVAKGGSLTIQASYIVDQAGWTPTYDIRAATGDTTVSLSYSALVYQNTGEDWNRVHLTLSTSKPALGGAPPEPLPWIIGTAESAFGSVEGFVRDAATGEPLVGANVWLPGTRVGAATDVNGFYHMVNVPAGNQEVRATYVGYAGVTIAAIVRPYSSTRADLQLPAESVSAQEVTVVSEARGVQKNATNAVRMVDQAPAAIAPKADRIVSYQTTSVTSAVTAASFDVPGESTIPSDNAKHRVAVMVASVGASFSYTTVPKMQTDAFLKAAMRNTTDFPILPGPMSVYLDNSFVTNSKLPAVLPGEPFEAFLGIDNGVHIERKILNRLTDQTGLFTRKRTVMFEIALSAENRKKLAQNLSIKEGIPISQDERIKVTVMEPKPEEGAPDAEGIITWKVRLAPGERREYRLRYMIEAPGDVNVGGME